jgi:hypothetical protein
MSPSWSNLVVLVLLQPSRASAAANMPRNEDDEDVQMKYKKRNTGARFTPVASLTPLMMSAYTLQ